MLLHSTLFMPRHTSVLPCECIPLSPQAYPLHISKHSSAPSMNTSRPPAASLPSNPQPASQSINEKKKKGTEEQGLTAREKEWRSAVTCVVCSGQKCPPWIHLRYITHLSLLNPRTTQSSIPVRHRRPEHSPRQVACRACMSESRMLQLGIVRTRQMELRS
jgi:hypothetical protein